MNIARAAQRARLRIIIPALAVAIAAMVIPLSQVASAHTTTRAAASGGPKPAIVLEHGASLRPLPRSSWTSAVPVSPTAAAAVLAMLRPHRRGRVYWPRCGPGDMTHRSGTHGLRDDVSASGRDGR